VNEEHFISRSEKPEVWIGLIEVAALPDCEIEELQEMAGAFVNILAWTDNAADYVAQVEAACAEMQLEVVQISDVGLLSQRDFEDEDEEEPGILMVGREVEETHEIAFDVFNMFEEGESNWDVLEEAITDIGYWCWWAEEFPDRVLIEFNGVQLWSEEPQEGQPSRGVVALNFSQPTSLCFLTRNAATDDLPHNWPDLMHDDKLENLPNIRWGGELHFNDREWVQRVLDGAQRIEVRFGLHPKTDEFFSSPVMLAFWAGDIGCVVGAQEMTLLNQSGEVSLDDVPELHGKWWEYWRDYWQRRDTAEAFPEDYACENTIPGAPEDEETEK
jgi:hypothetical protein